MQDLYALTRALMHLGDRVAWLSILRAPWLGLPLDASAGRSPAATASRPSGKLIKDDLFLCAVHQRPRARARQPRPRQPARRVEGVWLALGGPACVADKTELEDAEHLPRRARSASKPPARSPTSPRSRDASSSLYALPDVDATDDDLQIMTIHKAKGLEFGTVIVPGLDRGDRRSGRSADLLRSSTWKEQVASGGLLAAPIKATGVGFGPDLQIPRPPRHRSRRHRSLAPLLRRRHARREASCISSPASAATRTASSSVRPRTRCSRAHGTSPRDRSALKMFSGHRRPRLRR